MEIIKDLNEDLTRDHHNQRILAKRSKRLEFVDDDQEIVHIENNEVDAENANNVKKKNESVMWKGTCQLTHDSPWTLPRPPSPVDKADPSRDYPNLAQAYKAYVIYPYSTNVGCNHNLTPYHRH